MGKEMKDRKLGSGLVRNQYFVKGKGLKPQVIKFYIKISNISKSGDAVSKLEQLNCITDGARGIRSPATQRLLGSIGKAPSRWAMFCKFLEKIAILMPFGSHCAYFRAI